MSHSITLSEAITMTRRYREHREELLVPEQQNKNLLPLSETFDKAVIETLLVQTSCTALRIYYGMDENLKLHAILVGADALNADILPAILEGEEEDGPIVEQAIRCPPTCPLGSPLNEP